MELKAFVAGVFLLLSEGSQGYFDPNCGGKQVIVHLFEWKWTSIANECEQFLGPAGYCGVQVSPVHEHVLVTTDAMRPWWERYQPVSYKLTSRSGTDEEFVDMVQRCNAAGVRIYVDAVLNHMAGLGRSGIGSAGSSFDSDERDFPGVPFTVEDFTPRDMCPSGDGNVNDYSDPNNVRNCYLVGLTDLYGATDYVREKQIEFLNRLLEIGVAGFRVDAAKHMWPEDLEAIQGALDYPAFFYHEVIDRNDGAVTVDQYFELGRVTEFRYCTKIAWGIWDFSQLGNIVDFGWGMCPPEKAFVFVDNHDNQRGHGGAGDVITHKTPFEYKLGVSFMLAHPYGFTRVMSSYFFEDSSEGPPHDDNYNTLDVIINPDGTCGNGWVCEHRWGPIAHMVEFRNAVAGTEMANFFLEGDRVAFSRGDKGFFAMVKSGSMEGSFQTGMPGGSYCNIIDGCATQVTVNGDGTAQIRITDAEEPILAICVGCTGDRPTPDPTATTMSTQPTTPGPTEPPITDGIHRTVVFIHKQTTAGQDMFATGGVGPDQRPGCTEDAETSECAISITTNSLGEGEHYDKYNSWREGDTKLDWYGEQSGQGSFNGQPVEGTPLAWTSNLQDDPGYQPLNTYGEHYWMVDMDMDCSETEQGWFEVKGFVKGGVGEETDVSQAANCRGTAGGAAPYSSAHHMGKCGYLNVFKFSDPSCIIEVISE